MTTQTDNQTSQDADANDQPSGNKPDWVIKAPASRNGKSRLEQIGAGWNREDGGITLRTVGTQVVDGDIYLYPVNDSDTASSHS